MTKPVLKKPPVKRVTSSQTKFEKTIYFDLCALASIVVLGAIIYSNSFVCSFHLDDLNNIVNNKSIRNLWDINTWWNNSPNRPVSMFTFVLNYHFNQLDVWNYHLVNLVIHLSNACLVGWLTLLIFSSPALENNPIRHSKKTLALLVALLFVSHPLATQSVTYIVQRMAALAAMFYFLSLALYIKARLTEKNTVLKYLLFSCSLISAVAAMLSKENAFTLPVAVAMSELFFFSANKVSINFRDKRVFLLIAGFLGLCIFAGLKFSFSIFEPVRPSLRNDYTITSYNYLLTQFSVIVKYIGLLLLPVNQNVDYDYPLATGLFEIRTMLGFLLLLSLMVLAGFLFKRYRIISFGICWFFLTLSVESGIIPIRDLIFEHRTYLPSFGFFLILVAGLYVLLWEKFKYIAISILLFIIALNSYLTFERNKIWKDEFTLWSDVISKSPGKATPFVNRGSAYMATGQRSKAIADYSRAIQINPKHARAYCNRAIAFDELGQRGKALADYTKAIETDSTYKDAYSNRGALYYNLGQVDQAIVDYTRAIAIDSAYVKAYANRAIAYNNLGKWDQAMIDCARAIALDSNFTEAWFNRAIVHRNLEMKEESIADYSKVIELDPSNIKAYTNRGVVFAALEKWDRAIMDYSIVIRINPKSARAYFNRGVAFSKLEQWEKAIADYNSAIQIDPNYTKAYSAREAAYPKLNTVEKR